MIALLRQHRLISRLCLLASFASLAAACDSEETRPSVTFPVSPSPDEIPADVTSVRGIVLDRATGAPISGATVATLPATEVLRTDAEGGFILSNGVQGDTLYRVLVEAEGYAVASRVVLTRANARVTSDFQLDAAQTTSPIAFEPQATFFPENRHVSYHRVTNSSETETLEWSLEVPEWLEASATSGTLTPGATTILALRILGEPFAQTDTPEGRVLLRDDQNRFQILNALALKANPAGLTLELRGADGTELGEDPVALPLGGEVEVRAAFFERGRPLVGAEVIVQADGVLSDRVRTDSLGEVVYPVQGLIPGQLNLTFSLPSYPDLAPKQAALLVLADDIDEDGVADDVDNCLDIPNPEQEDADEDGIGDACEPDSDDDGAVDDVDNCLDTSNPEQTDTDEDGAGDACDVCPADPDDDADEDGVCGDEDNCPELSNAEQEDADEDGAGDACDACPNDPADDLDEDGVCGDIDNCPSVSNADQEDDDGDGIGNLCESDGDTDGVIDDIDNCLEVSNPEQEDGDEDGQGDACDVCPGDPDDDADEDGVCGDIDNCPELSNPEQADDDGDGIGNLCEGDRDSDGVIDDIDNCIDAPNPEQGDSDEDGIGDLCEPDSDDDGVIDDVDNCLEISNPEQEDGDEDGQGDACDVCANDFDNDSDEDGVCGDVDNCPELSNAEQEDADEDGAGDVCDVCPGDPDDDADEDGVCGDEDNCPGDFNPEQEDTFGGPEGDVCEDRCPFTFFDAASLINFAEGSATGFDVETQTLTLQLQPGTPEITDATLTVEPFNFLEYGGGDPVDLPVSIEGEVLTIALDAGFDFAANGIGDARLTLNHACNPDEVVDITDLILQVGDPDEIGAIALYQLRPAVCSDDDLGEALGEVIAEGNTRLQGRDQKTFIRQPERSCPDTISDDVSLLWTAPEAGKYAFSTAGSNFDTVLYALPPVCAGEVLECNDDDFRDETSTSRMELDLEEGESIVLVVAGYETDNGDYQLGAELICAAVDDLDGDDICAEDDNCPDVFNPRQSDSDEDGIGDDCDACPFDFDNDLDADGVCGDIDNCPGDFNPEQEDIDEDGQGDACDVCPGDFDNDLDEDEVCGDVDNCPDDFNPGQEDTFGGPEGDACEDRCPFTFFDAASLIDFTEGSATGLDPDTQVLTLQLQPGTPEITNASLTVESFLFQGEPITLPVDAFEDQLVLDFLSLEFDLRFGVITSAVLTIEQECDPEFSIDITDLVFQAGDPNETGQVETFNLRPRECAEEDLGARIGPSVASGSTVLRGRDHDEPLLFGEPCVFTQSDDVGHVWTAPRDGLYEFSTAGSNFDTVLYALPAQCGGDDALECNDDDFFNETSTSRFELELLQGESIVLVVAGSDTDAGAYDLNIDLLSLECEIGDSDNDAWCDLEDNCPFIPNSDQSDIDGDGTGDLCDDGCPDMPLTSADINFDADSATGFDTETLTFTFEMGPGAPAVLEATLELEPFGFGGYEGGGGDPVELPMQVEGSVLTVTLNGEIDPIFDGIGAARLKLVHACSGGATMEITDLVVQILEGDGGLEVANFRPTECVEEDLGSAEGESVFSGFTFLRGRDHEPLIGGRPCLFTQSDDIGLLWTAPRAGEWTIDTFGSRFDTVLYALPPECTADALACNDDAGETFQSEISVFLEEGESIVIVAAGYDTETGVVVVNINDFGVAR